MLSANNLKYCRFVYQDESVLTNSNISDY
jgi:hypothetical protein